MSNTVRKPEAARRSRLQKVGAMLVAVTMLASYIQVMTTGPIAQAAVPVTPTKDAALLAGRLMGPGVELTGTPTLLSTAANMSSSSNTQQATFSGQLGQGRDGVILSTGIASNLVNGTSAVDNESLKSWTSPTGIDFSPYARYTKGWEDAAASLPDGTLVKAVVDGRTLWDIDRLTFQFKATETGTVYLPYTWGSNEIRPIAGGGIRGDSFAILVNGTNRATKFVTHAGKIYGEFLNVNYNINATTVNLNGLYNGTISFNGVTGPKQLTAIQSVVRADMPGVRGTFSDTIRIDTVKDQIYTIDVFLADVHDGQYDSYVALGELSVCKDGVCPQADLKVSSTVPTIKAGDTGVSDVIVSNASTKSDASNVTFTYTAPTNVEIPDVQMSAGCTRVDTKVASCTVGTLAKGTASKSFPIPVKVLDTATPGTTYSDGLVQAASPDDKDGASAPSAVKLAELPKADADFTKSVAVTAVGTKISKAGDKLTYTFTAANTGEAVMTDVSVTDPKCAVAPVRAGVNMNDAAFDGGDVFTWTCDYTVTQADIDAGKVDNTATFKATANAAPFERTASATAGTDLFSIANTLGLGIKNGHAPTVVGAKAQFTFDITNNGQQTLSNTGFKTVTGCDSTPVVTSQGDGNDTLSRGETWTFTCTATVTAEKFTAGAMIVSAEAQGTSPGAKGPNVFSSLVTSTLTLIAPPVITKADGQNASSGAVTTKDETPSVAGSAQADAVTVKVFEEGTEDSSNPKVLCEAPVTAGAWSCDALSVLPINATTKIVAKAYDAVGSQSMASNLVAVTVDQIAPNPVIELTSVAGDDVLSLAEQGVGTAPIVGKVTGDFKANDTVALTVNGVKRTGKVDARGNFTINVATAELKADASRTVHASVVTYDEAGNESSATTERMYTVMNPIALSVEKSNGANNANMVAGKPSTYTVKVSNAAGSEAAASATFKDVLADGLSFKDGSVTGGSCTVDQQAVTCTVIGPINGGESKTLTFQVVPSRDLIGASVRNTVRVDTTGGNTPGDPATCLTDPNLPGCSTTPAVTVDGVKLSVTKSNPAEDLVINKEADYSIVITNEGTLPTSAAYTISDLLPATVEYVSADGAACAASGSVAAGQLVNCEVSGELAAKASKTVTLKVKPTAVVAAPGVKNSVRVDVTGGQKPVKPTDPTDPNGPAGCAAYPKPAGCDTTDPIPVKPMPSGLYVSKQGPESMTVGVESSFTVTVKNVENAVNPDSATISDALEPGLKFIGSDGADCGTPTGDVATGLGLKCTVTGPITTAGKVFTIKVMPTESMAGKTFTNTAIVDPTGGTDPKPDVCTTTPTACSTTDPIEVTDGVALKVEKFNPVSLTVGVPADYTIKVSNTGSGPAKAGSVVKDKLSANIEFVKSDVCTAAGQVADGQLLTCTISSEIAAHGGLFEFTVTVKPTAAAVGQTVKNKASIGDKDPATCDPNVDKDQCVETSGVTVTPGAKIIGSVFNDYNKNGIRETGEPDISLVDVQLYIAGPDGQLGTADDVLVLTATTHSPYIFSHLLDGTYLIKVVRGVALAGMVASTPESYEVTINAQTSALDKDFGFYNAPDEQPIEKRKDPVSSKVIRQTGSEANAAVLVGLVLVTVIGATLVFINRRRK